MSLVDRHELLEEALAGSRAAVGAAYDAYRGHAYRVFNCARRFVGDARADDTLAIAAAFHDVGIWTARTFDYLPPSVAEARRWCGGRADADVVARAIENHHRLRRYRTAPAADVIEAFRKADLVDVSRAWWRGGLPRAFGRELASAFPYRGFHRLLVVTAARWIVRHPLRPLPMLKW